jgi:predicted enzyme related to lactoylglutathione lyase
MSKTLASVYSSLPFSLICLGKHSSTENLRAEDMNAKITHVALVVKNRDEAVEFYTKKVGFEKKADYNPPAGDRWVTVGPKGQDLELVLLQAGTSGVSNSSTHITMQVDDCKNTSAELKSRGVQFKQEPIEHLYGISAIFVDPDGNSFQINQFPQKGS